MSRKSKAHFPKRALAREPAGADVGTTSSGTGWVRRTLTATLLSDAHLGSGSGGGDVDALIARDREERPVIWASHVEGVLRDAARRLRGDAEAEAFFGRAGGDYARGDRQRAVFTSLYANTSPESHIWRSTARAAFDNRAPQGDTQRVIEYAPKGTQLVGEVELPASDLPTLERLLQEVDALGRGRSTGAGRVKLSLSEAAAVSRQVGSPTNRLVLLLENRDPICVTATATPDNLIPSLAFVPGRTLLGALAAWLIAEGDRDAASLLTSGQISVSDALPLPKAPAELEGVEVLPAPLSLQSQKPSSEAHEGAAPWWAEATRPTHRLDAWTTKDKLKRPEDDLFVYRGRADKAWTTFRPARRVRLRNGRPDPRQAHASLFAIEQIVEKTHFLAEIRGSSDDLNALTRKLAPVLEGRRWLRIGRAGAPVEVARLAWSSDAAPAASTTTKAPGKALLTITSDLLVRDEWLRWRTALDQAALEELLLRVDVQLGKSLQDSVVVHGFNGTSRLWLMPAAAIRRGSVFEISGSGVAKLAERATKGEWLGERTHEGFGHFRLDVSLPGVTEEAATSTAPTATEDSAEEATAAKTKEWFNAHKSLADANKKDRDGRKPPSLSQWLDLVADLERDDQSALTDRLNPMTSGGKSWRHKEAQAVLKRLEALQQQRALHAQLFVRWLRAERRAQQAKGAQ